MLCRYFVGPLSFNLSGLGGPNRGIKTPASIVIRVTAVRNPPPRKGDSTRGGFEFWLFECCWNIK